MDVFEADLNVHEETASRGSGRAKKKRVVLAEERLYTYYASFMLAQVVTIVAGYSATLLARTTDVDSQPISNSSVGTTVDSTSSDIPGQDFMILLVVMMLAYQARYEKQHKKAAKSARERQESTEAPSSEKLQQTFQSIDTDSSGHIDSRELQKALQSLGLDPSLRECDDMIYEADTDKSGGVSFDEFETIVANAGSAWFQIDSSLQAQVARMDEQRWHGKMCFMPLIIMILCTLMTNTGLATTLYYYATVVNPCALGIVDGVRNITAVGAVLLLTVLVSLAGVFVFGTLLSMTHFKLYKDISLVVGSMKQDSPKGMKAAKRLQRPNKVWTYFVFSIMAQILLFFIFSLGKDRVEDELGNGGSEEGDPDATKLVTIVLHAFLMFGSFYIGQQLGAIGDYYSYSEEVDFKDLFQVRKRMEWHGSMLYRPTTVAIIQCFIFFPSMFQMAPYYRRSTVPCHRDFMKNIAALDATGVLGGLGLTLVFCLLQFILILLCMQHFKQFMKYSRALL